MASSQNLRIIQEKNPLSVQRANLRWRRTDLKAAEKARDSKRVHDLKQEIEQIERRIKELKGR